MQAQSRSCTDAGRCRLTALVEVPQGTTTEPGISSGLLLNLQQTLWCRYLPRINSYTQA